MARGNIALTRSRSLYDPSQVSALRSCAVLPARGTPEATDHKVAWVRRRDQGDCFLVSEAVDGLSLNGVLSGPRVAQWCFELNGSLGRLPNNAIQVLSIRFRAVSIR